MKTKTKGEICKELKKINEELKKINRILYWYVEIPRYQLIDKIFKEIEEKHKKSSGVSKELGIEPIILFSESEWKKFKEILQLKDIKIEN